MILRPSGRLIPGHTTFASEKGLYGVWPGISQRAAAARSRKLPALVGQFIFSTWARAQARERGGGWARRAQA